LSGGQPRVGVKRGPQARLRKLRRRFGKAPRWFNKLGRRLRRSPRFFQLMVAARGIRLLDRRGLRSYAAARGKLWPLQGPERSVDLAPLRGPIQPLPADTSGLAIGSHYPWTFQEEFVCELEDVTLLGHKPFVVTRDGRFVLDSLVSTRRENVKLEETLRRIASRHGLAQISRGFTGKGRIERRARRLGHVCLLTDGLQRSYYHWVLEQLTKLRAVEEYRRQTGETPTLVLPKRHSPWMSELVGLVGFGDAEISEWGGPRDGRAERLVLPTYPEPSPATLRWLRERVVGAGASRPEERGERILIARGEGRRWWRRAIVNQEELAAALEPLGFRSYRLGDMPVAEQARLFDRAEAVVGAHGAGLTNLVFSPSASVLELFGRNVRPHFFRLAHVLGLPYRYQLCEPASMEGIEPPGGGRAAPSHPLAEPPGLRVDPDEIKAALADMGIR